MPTNVRRFFSHDHVCVLLLTLTTPDDTDSIKSDFYSPIAEGFEQMAENRLFPLAKNAYDDSADRRKRFRYIPWQAEFMLTQEGDVMRLSATSCGKTHILEEHTWKDGVIVKRKRYKKPSAL